MLKIIKFIKIFIKKSRENELLLMSNALTYRLLISIFPFIIFLMTLMGFLNVSGIKEYLIEMGKALPDPVQDIIEVFLSEVIETRRISLLSTSFLISIYGTSTGFNSIIQGLNRAYEQNDTRTFFKKRLTSITLAFLFAFLVNFSLIFFIFNDYIKAFIIKNTYIEIIPYFLDSISIYISVGLILLIMVMFIYKFSVFKKLTIVNVFPGALFTVISWLVLSKGFNIYINNFSRYSMIYGSIGGIFVLVIWINMISLVLLLGGQLNAILENLSYYMCIEK